MKKYYLSPHPPQIYFSHREAQCMAYFLQGYSNRGVSQQLQIACSTVDSYAAKMKFKLKCKSKTELIAKVCQTGFIEYMAELLPDTK